MIILSLKISPVSHQFVNLFDRYNRFYTIVFINIFYNSLLSVTFNHINLKAKSFIKVDFSI